MNYKDEWVKITNRKIKKLDIYILKSGNLFCKCSRSLIKYNLILRNLHLMLNSITLKNILYLSLSEIINIQKELSNCKLTKKTHKNFSRKFRNISNKINLELNLQPNKYLIPDFKFSWEHQLIQDLIKLLKSFESIDLFDDKLLNKQISKINLIFTYLKKRLPLILESSRFYFIIRVSIQKITFLRTELEFLSNKYKKKLKRTFKNYLQEIKRWKKMRYYYIWLTNQIPILIEHRQLLVEYLFPRNYL